MATKAKTTEDRPKKTQIPPQTKGKELRNIRYSFTPEEMSSKSRMLAEACSKKTQIEAEKKSVVSEFKAKIDAQDSQINLLSCHITNGFETRNVECEVDKNYETGFKTYTFEGKEYDKVALTNLDRQTELNLINQARAKADNKTNGDGKVADHKEGPVKESQIPGASYKPAPNSGPTSDVQEEEGEKEELD